MKKQLAILALLISIIFSSCSIEKRHYSKGYNIEWRFKHSKLNSEDLIKGSGKEITIKTDSANLKSENLTASINPAILIDSKVKNMSKFSEERTIIEAKNTTLLKNSEDACDELIQKNGVIIYCKIIEIGVNEIKYKKCDNPDGPLYSSLKSEIFMIKYVNGETEVFNNSSQSNINNDSKKTDGLAIASMCTGVVGLILAIVSFYLPLILGLLGIIFGAISLSRIRKNPETLKGKGLAKSGVITGIIVVGLFTLLLILGIALVL